MKSVPPIVHSAPELRGFQRFWRALKQLFLEIIAALFAILALAWLNAAFRSWTRDVAHWLIATAIGVAVLFMIFAVTTFRRSRRL
jgi:multisubunit Na+/H+ antiporter MnhB subunit